MDGTNTVAIGDVTLIPLIVGTIQLIKRFAPDAPGNIWLALAYLFGFAGQTVVFLMAKGTNIAAWDFTTWAVVVVTGMWFGYTSTQAWDNVVRPPLMRASGPA